MYSKATVNSTIYIPSVHERLTANKYKWTLSLTLTLTLILTPNHNPTSQSIAFPTALYTVIVLGEYNYRYAPPPLGGALGLKAIICLSIRLSRSWLFKSRTEGHRKLKISRKEAHDTGDPWPHLEIKRSRSPDRLTSWLKISHVFRTGRPTNFKLGILIDYDNNNNNNNTHDNVYSAVIMTTRSLREFTRFIWWM